VDPPALIAERQSEGDQAEVVALALGTGEKRARAVASPPAAGQAEQASPQDVGGEVLLRDGQLAALPAVADVVQIRHHDLREQRAQRRDRQQPVEDGLRPGLVERLERAAEVGARAGGVERRRPGLRRRPRVRLSDERGRRLSDERGRLAGRQAIAHVPLHRSHPLQVARRVQPQAAGRPLRAQHAVPALPGAQELDADARAAAELADPQVGVVGHVTEPYTTCTRP
jgi:hypothetical protein